MSPQSTSQNPINPLDPYGLSEIDLSVPLVKLSKDLRDASGDLSRHGARWVTTIYYTIQNDRIRTGNQYKKMSDGGEPHQLISWILYSMESFEAGINGALGSFAAEYKIGKWLQAQYGIGNVLSAALLSSFDIRKAPTVGHFWRFAGLDPSLHWLGKDDAKKAVEKAFELPTRQDAFEYLHDLSGQHVAKIREIFINGWKPFGGGAKKKGVKALETWLAVRPYNANLKAICAYRLGEMFVRGRNKENCFYGQLFGAKKNELTEQNFRGEFAATAEREGSNPRLRKTTEKYKWNSGQFKVAEVRAAWEAEMAFLDDWHSGVYAADVSEFEKAKDRNAWRDKKKAELVPEVPRHKPGEGDRMLAPGHIHDRARRWVVKMVISHLHEMMYREYYGTEPPAPWIFEQPGDHRHLITPPFRDEEFAGRTLREMAD